MRIRYFHYLPLFIHQPHLASGPRFRLCMRYHAIPNSSEFINHSPMARTSYHPIIAHMLIPIIEDLSLLDVILRVLIYIKHVPYSTATNSSLYKQSFDCTYSPLSILTLDLGVTPTLHDLVLCPVAELRPEGRFAHNRISTVATLTSLRSKFILTVQCLGDCLCL